MPIDVSSNGPTGREWGSLTKEVQELRHDIKNIQMVMDAQTEIIRDLELRLSSISTKIYTTLSVSMVFGGTVGFFINLLMSMEALNK